MKNQRLSRRSFVKASSAFAVPFVLPSHIWAAETPPSEVINMGFIGMGKQNGGLMRNFLGQKNVRVLAVCDVDTNRREAALKSVQDWHAAKPDERGSSECIAAIEHEAVTEHDDIDAVCIATPDHWHAIPTISALEHGKDVYCEKPLTHNIHEAVEVIKAVEKNDRVLQTGSMQRSMKEFRAAVELVRNGHIGELTDITCSFGDPGKPYDLPEEEMEPGLDWDRWLGPAQKTHYNSILSPRGVHNNFPRWRNYREFGGGMVTDWGAHHLDIAQWGLGMDESGPVKALPPPKEGDKRGASLVYANGLKVTHGASMGVTFNGTEGTVHVTRGRIDFQRDGKSVHKWTKREDGGSLNLAIRDIDKDVLGAEPDVMVYRSGHHIKDFLGAMASRKKPITSEIVGGRTAICCHLMNQAYYNHTEIAWNPETNTFAEGGDPAWLTRDYRSPWTV